MARRKLEAAGPPEWIVTFADLMSLLLCFFILIVSFSVQDDKKVQMVAGSMREAFGVVPNPRRAGIIEMQGLPTREFLRHVGPMPNRDTDIGFEAPDNNASESNEQQRRRREQDETRIERERRFATAAATLRQSWMDQPEIAALTQNILLEETPEGLEIRLVDQDHRAMFPEGSRFPLERTRAALSALAPVIARMPNRITITGHTSSRRFSGQRPNYGPWELSADRANAVRQILVENGLRADRIHMVGGKADSEPLFPQDPTMAANGRVTILLKTETAPLPARMRP